MSGPRGSAAAKAEAGTWLAGWAADEAEEGVCLAAAGPAAAGRRGQSERQREAAMQLGAISARVSYA